MNPNHLAGHEPRPKNPFANAGHRFKAQRSQAEVKKATRVAGKRIAGAQRAEQARQQKRRDARPH